MLSGKLDVTTPAAQDFALSFGEAMLTKADLQFYLCSADALQNWNGKNPAKLEFVEAFATGENAGALMITSRDDLHLSKTDINILYVIRNQDGNPVYISTDKSTAIELWQAEYYRLMLPALPTTAGAYTIDVYFNNGLAATLPFTIA